VPPHVVLERLQNSIAARSYSLQVRLQGRKRLEIVPNGSSGLLVVKQHKDVRVRLQRRQPAFTFRTAYVLQNHSFMLSKGDANRNPVDSVGGIPVVASLHFRPCG